MDEIRPEILHRESSYPNTSIVIDPLNHCLVSDVRVCIFDNATRALSTFILRDHEILRIPENSQKTKLKYKLQTKSNGKWFDATPYIHILPTAFQANLPKSIYRFGGGLSATLRRNVVLSPYKSLYRKNPPWGYFGAYENGFFIPEAHHVVMGKQAYVSAPEPEVRKNLEGTYIYGDSLGGAYGHVITEGISRLWYARQNPEIPVIWVRGGQLSPVHKRILDFLQIRNPHVFLREHVMVDECIFPLPSLSIGDYIQPGYFDFVGVEPPQEPISGKRIFLSRSKQGAPGRIQSEAANLDALMVRFGFELFFPEQHDLKEQLRVISSAEIVSGVEGSAFHSLVFYEKAPKTRFVALGRHRMGSGIYSQIKHGKGLDYITLSIIRGSDELRLNARSDVSIDLDVLEETLSLTHGFAEMAALPQRFICDDTLQPSRNYLDIVSSFPAKMNRPQSVITELIADFDKMDRQRVLEKLGEIFSFVS